MKDYIERAAVESMLENAQIVTDGEYCGYCTEDVNLGSIPTADVVEVRHGRWIWNSHHCKWECSECGGMEGECESPVCKWCGARMDKEDEE